MKKVLLFLPFLLLFACQNQPAEQEAKPVEPISTSFKGQIENADGGELNLMIGEEKTTVTVDENGQFSGSLMMTEPAFATIQYQRERTGLYLEPGDALDITFDTKEFDETITYTGNGAEENNYLAKKALMEEEMMSDWRAVFGAEKEDFIATMDESKTKLLANFKESTTSEANMNSDFVAMEKQNILLGDANNRMMYPEYYAYLKKGDEPEMDANYYDFLSKINLNNESMLQMASFKNFVQSFVNHKASEIAGEADDKFATPNASLAVISQNFKNQEIKNHAYHQLMNGLLYEHGADIPQNIVMTFKKECKNEDFQKEIMEEYDKWTAVAKGKDAPGWNYEKTDGKFVALDDLKGKVVYVDVWATWCGPCKAEIPHLEELVEEYEGKGKIAFTSVSIDKNKDAWLKMVEEKEMKGVQVYADKAWESSICNDYLIKGIPRFILIDEEGKVIDANAPRPSSKEIKEIFAKIHDKNTLTSMK